MAGTIFASYSKCLGVVFFISYHMKRTREDSYRVSSSSLPHWWCSRNRDAAKAGKKEVFFNKKSDEDEPNAWTARLGLLKRCPSNCMEERLWKVLGAYRCLLLCSARLCSNPFLCKPHIYLNFEKPGAQIHVCLTNGHPSASFPLLKYFLCTPRTYNDFEI